MKSNDIRRAGHLALLPIGAFEMEHVNAWRRADKRSFSDAERYRETLLSMWFKTRWSTTFCGRKVVGELKTVNEYGAGNAEPSFTIEFPDPDYPSGDNLTLTGHFSRFEASKEPVHG